MTSRRKIADRLRLARTWQNQSQAQLARLTNRSQPEISRIENAKESMVAEEIALFSRALGVQPAYFVNEDVDIANFFRVE